MTFHIVCSDVGKATITVLILLFLSPIFTMTFAIPISLTPSCSVL